MLAKTYPVRGLLMTLAGLLHRHQADCIADLLEENRVLKENWIQPAPDRPSYRRSFLQTHWGQVTATDFSSVEV